MPARDMKLRKTAVSNVTNVYQETPTVTYSGKTLTPREAAIQARKERYAETDGLFLGLFYDNVVEGRALDNDNFREWTDAVAQVKKDIPLPE